MVLDALLICPLDTRRDLAKNIVITGGMSIVMGFKARLFEELKYLLQVTYVLNQTIFKWHKKNWKERF